MSGIDPVQLTAFDLSGKKRPRPLLTQNSRLKTIGVKNWSLPALAARLQDGRTVKTCPAAGVCAQICYALQGTYQYPNVKERHIENLAYVLEDLNGWARAMRNELSRSSGNWIRIHDAGDFFSREYLIAWLSIMRARPHVNFYCYTKEVALFKELVEPDKPPNFKFVYSLGGREDGLLNLAVDRVADVFPTEADIEPAGFHSQKGNDLLAVTGPAPVGMAANNIPKFKKRQGRMRLSEWQELANTRRPRGPR
ncbi:GP88 family protein [Nonomuraea jabiensis]|uniref:GP88 family protein n=1 Tax=Nonomuraea jabiensis TaxID=882448 RepID=UPI003D749EB2